MYSRIMLMTSALLVVVTSPMTSARPYSGHFTVIRPGGETISENFINTAGSPAHYQNINKNSPTYFIRLAPSPYTFVPGLGYVSNPPVKNPFFSVNFPSNGKPTGLYSLSSLLKSTTTTTTPAPPISRADSPISWMKGRYTFNGRPGDSVTAVRAPTSSALLNALLARNRPSRFSTRRGKLDSSLW